MIVGRFAALPLLLHDRQEHIEAAARRNQCWCACVGFGTIDSPLAQFRLRHKPMLLTTDNDFRFAARHCALRVWSAVHESSA
jgi:hypothetical protein